MIDLAIITAIVARDRVVDQFAGPAVTAAAPRVPVVKSTNSSREQPERVQFAVAAATS